MSPSPRDVFLRLIHGVAEARLHELPGLYAESTDIRHPMATPPVPPLESRNELERHFAGPPGMEPPTWTRRPVDITVHETADPEVVVGEFAYEVTHADGAVVMVPCVFVMRVRDGEIVESRDYIDPIRAAQARGALDDLITALRTTP